MDLQLQGKIAWVTGGAGGIGLAICQALRAEGATVLSTDLTDHAPDDKPEIRYQRCDVTDQSDIDSAVATCRAELGGLDILVNNAAVTRTEQFLDVTHQTWDRLIDVNLTGYFFCAQAAARLMIEQGRGGAIVNMSSLNGSHPNARTLVYSITKGGINSLTLGLASGLGRHGIRVNAIAPWGIDTPMAKSFVPDPEHVAEELRRIGAATALGRFGLAIDVAPMVVFLVSDQAAYITGAVVPVTGGRGITAAIQ